MNVEELIVRLRIEEDNMRSEKRVLSQFEIKANVVEHGQSSNLKKKDNQRVQFRTKMRNIKEAKIPRKMLQL